MKKEAAKDPTNVDSTQGSLTKGFEAKPEPTKLTSSIATLHKGF